MKLMLTSQILLLFLSSLASTLLLPESLPLHGLEISKRDVLPLTSASTSSGILGKGKRCSRRNPGAPRPDLRAQTVAILGLVDKGDAQPRDVSYRSVFPSAMAPKTELHSSQTSEIAIEGRAR